MTRGRMTTTTMEMIVAVIVIIPDMIATMALAALVLVVAMAPTGMTTMSAIANPTVIVAAIIEPAATIIATAETGIAVVVTAIEAVAGKVLDCRALIASKARKILRTGGISESLPTANRSSHQRSEWTALEGIFL